MYLSAWLEKPQTAVHLRSMTISVAGADLWSLTLASLAAPVLRAHVPSHHASLPLGLSKNYKYVSPLLPWLGHSHHHFT